MSGATFVKVKVAVICGKSATNLLYNIFMKNTAQNFNNLADN